MGSGQSFTTYEEQLLEQKELRSYEVPNSAEKGTTSIYRSLTAKNGFAGFLKITEEKEEIELDTAWKLFTIAVQKYGTNDFVGFRPWTDKNDPTVRGDYQWMTYNTFYNDYVLPYGNGLQELGVTAKTNVGIFSKNRPEWYAVHIGNLSQSFRSAALYDTLGPTAVSFIVAHAESEVVVCEKDKLPYLFEAIEQVKAGMDDEKNDRYETYKGFKLKYIIQIDHDEVYGNVHEAVDDADRAKAQEYGMTLLGYSEVIAKGRGKTNIVEPTPDDLAYIMYTSGTTGDPKGVMLSHRCFAQTVATGTRKFENNSDDVHISYLPLAHIFETSAQAMMSSQGARVAYYQGDIRKIAEDWKAVRPTFLVGVPRIYGKTYDKFEATKQSLTGIKGWLVGSAHKKSKESIRKGRRSSFYDKVVWSKIPAQMGFDRVRILVSGAAPLPPHIAEFLRILLPNAAVFQGYGLTETCAGGTITDADDFCLGHVGVPVDNYEVRLIDAPECEYLTSDQPHPRGEIQFRSFQLMNGYYKNQKKTDEVLSADGWFSTGDIGRINPNGTLSIIDRRKNLFKISSGEYIATEKVEAQYTKVRSISQCFVYANSQKAFIVGIVVPDASNLMQFFKSQGWVSEAEANIQPGTTEFCNKFNSVSKAHVPEIKARVKEDIDEWVNNDESGLLKFELMKDFAIEPEIDELLSGFTVANDCLTPSFKKKRPQLTKRYLETIKQLYADNGSPAGADENW